MKLEKTSHSAYITSGNNLRIALERKTRDVSRYAYCHLSGQLRMDEDRNFANIARHTGVPEQNMHHFMSNSPWSARVLIQRIQEDIAANPDLRGGVIILGDSADKKSGEMSVGAGRQYNGRLGKVDLSQVGTFLTYIKGPIWTWIDGSLYLPESWFTPEMAEVSERLGVLSDLNFKTKIELGLEMIMRAKANGISFEAVCCDTTYGRSTWFRSEPDRAGIVYMADVPRNTRIYLKSSDLLSQSRKKLRSVSVHKAAHIPGAYWQRIRVRDTERGFLSDEFGFRRVWTIRNGEPSEEWLVVRKSGRRYTYSLSNAPFDTSPERLAWLKCQRYFAERATQDAKSEVGWDELQAQKYRAWEHHVALTVLGSWFVGRIKLDWLNKYGESGAQKFETEVSPMLSMANVRDLLRAAMPLSQLTPEKVRELIMEHLVNRARSRRSRMKFCYYL